jgi:hypothetical protein
VGRKPLIHMGAVYRSSHIKTTADLALGVAVTNVGESFDDRAPIDTFVVGVDDFHVQVDQRARHGCDETGRRPEARFVDGISGGVFPDR